MRSNWWLENACSVLFFMVAPGLLIVRILMPIYKTRILGSIIAVSAVAGCASVEPVEVVPVEPAGCALLGSVAVLQLGPGPAVGPAIADLVKQTRALGGNTLQCCEIGREETTLYARDRRSGKLYAGAYEHTGRSFNCAASENEHHR